MRGRRQAAAPQTEETCSQVVRAKGIPPSGPGTQLTARGTAVKPPKGLDGRLVRDPGTVGDETWRIPEAGKPRRPPGDLLVHRRIAAFAKSESISHHSHGANAIVAGPSPTRNQRQDQRGEE